MTPRLLPLFVALGGILSVPVSSVSAAEPGPLPAHIVVHLPAEARLAVNGQATNSTSATRRFVTPPLERGKDFEYTFKARWMRDRDAVAVTKVVPVRAGRQVAVSFALPTASDRSERALSRSTLYGAWLSASQPGVTAGYDATFDPPSSFMVPARSPRVAPLSGQDPMRGGPPGSNSPLSLGVGQG